MSEHYFSANPTTARKPREVTVSLRGMEQRVVTDAGVFSADGLDRGTAVLLKEVPEPALEGNLLDLGCGWGPLTLCLGAASPQAQVYAVDVNERALELTAENARRWGLTNIHVSTPEKMADDVRFATIWSNPPIRVGKAALHGMLETWLPRLAPKGSAYLVVSKDLGGDSLQRWLTEKFPTFEVSRLSTAKGFRVLEVLNR